MNTNNINALVSQAMIGSNDAFEELIKIKAESILFFTRSILDGSRDEKDVTQNIIADMYHSISNLEDPALFNAWLHKIIINHCDGLKQAV